MYEGTVHMLFQSVCTCMVRCGTGIVCVLVQCEINVRVHLLRSRNSMVHMQLIMIGVTMVHMRFVGLG